MTLNAIIRNAPDYPAVGQIEVYDNPAGKLMFRIANGAGGFEVLNVKEDPTGAKFANQPYLWFQMQFPGNMKGWVRDEYIMLQGDGSRYGLGKIEKPLGAFTIVHGSANIPTEQSAPPAETKPADEPKVVAPVSNLDRVLRAALDITATFEGGYSSYQANPGDAGIVSYGRFQFTLAHGALYKVVDNYVRNAGASAVAQEIMSLYLDRVRKKDETLRSDERFKQLLREAAAEPAMQNAQNTVAKEKYWDVIIELSATPRGIVTPLGRALMLDMGINHGIYHDYFTIAEQTLKVKERSAMPGNGATEQQFFTIVANTRKDRMYALADKHGWNGLKVRADFWVNIVTAGDWDLQGDANGKVYPKSGREVSVR